jgi:hypothetical protein
MDSVVIITKKGESTGSFEHIKTECTYIYGYFVAASAPAEVFEGAEQGI